MSEISCLHPRISSSVAKDAVQCSKWKIKKNKMFVYVYNIYPSNAVGEKGEAEGSVVLQMSVLRQ